VAVKKLQNLLNCKSKAILKAPDLTGSDLNFTHTHAKKKENNGYIQI